MSENSRQGSLFGIRESVKPPAVTDPGGHTSKREITFVHDEEMPATDQAEKVAQLEGPSVKISNRNRALAGAIGLVASISRAEGLRRASEIPSERSRLQNRYGGRTDEVIENTVKKSENDAVRVPEEFAKAWGLDEVVASQLMSVVAAEDAMAKEYRQFEEWFGGSGTGADRREAKKRWLNFQRRTLHRERTRRPTVDYPRHPYSR